MGEKGGLAMNRMVAAKLDRRLLYGLLLVLVLPLLSGVRGSTERPARNPGPRFASRMSLAPAGTTPEVWKRRVGLEDLASGEVLSAPTVVLPAGEEAGVRSAIGPGEIFEFAVRVGPSPDAASWRSRVVADGQILDRSAGSVRLAKESP